MSKHYPLLALLLSTAFPTFAQNPTPESRVKQKTLAADGSPTLISFRVGGTRYRLGEANQALREQLQLSQDERMVLVKTEADAQGFTHEKYQQYYRGIKVEHATYTVHTQSGSIESLTGHLNHVGQVDISPKLTAKVALDRALAFVGAKHYMWQLPQEEAGLKQWQNNPAASYLPQGELVIVNSALGKPTLAWKFDVYAQEPLSRAYIYVDAATGEVVLQDAIMKSITAPFATRYSGTRNIETEANPGGGYHLIDGTRGNGVQTFNTHKASDIYSVTDFVDNDNNWTAAEYDNANFDNVAGDAHFGAEATYDYWKNVHGRNSWNNAGGQLLSFVHFGQGWDNARWDGFRMLYGDGSTIFKPLTSLDVAAHEIGHGVCQATAGLIYANEPGALNEGFSDIWAACIEQYTTAALGLTKSTWLIGEEIVKSGAASRSMSDPKSLGQPAYYQGQKWVPTTPYPSNANDQGGVHTDSGVLNFWFYILSQGKSGTNEGGNAYYVSGISITSAARIAYRAESIYLTPNSQYVDARTFTIKAAEDLFGLCSPEVIATTNAWYAVGVGPNPPITPPITGPNTVCTSPTPFQVNASNVVWTASPANLFTVASGSGGQFSTQAQPGAAGRGIITATVCGGITASIPVTVGSPGPDAINGYTDTGLWRIKASVTAVLGATSYKWYVNDVLQTSSQTTFITIPIAHECDRSYSVQVEAINSCGISERTSQNFDASCLQNYALSVYPNPAANQLTVESTDSTGQVTPATFEATLFDKYSRVKKVQETTKGRVEILTQDLPAGIYYLEVKRGGTVQRKQISIQP